VKLHLLAHLVQQVEILAFEQQRGGAQMALVLGPVDR